MYEKVKPTGFKDKNQLFTDQVQQEPFLHL